jgi:16S rRNA (uracil1498-N3)-methyltransferase
MNLRRVPLSPLATGEQQLSRELGSYVVKVLRLRAGDPFVVFDPEAATEADAVLVRDVPAVAKVGAVRVAERAMGRSVRLLQGLSKGDKPDQIVRAAVALGAFRLSFVRTERSIPGAELRTERLRAVMLDAARQCGRGDLPRLDELLDLEDAAPRAGQWRFALDPQADRSLSDALRGTPPDGDVTLAVGPEGGFSVAEYDWLVGLGYRRVRLAPYVLRTELAAVAALAVVTCHE